MDIETGKLLLTGFVAGISAGFFGIGGGLIIVPSLVFLMGFTQQKATGTSLAILLPPLGLGAVMVYHRNNNVDIKAACIIGALLAVGAWAGSLYANRMPEAHLKLAFGIFAMVMGAYQIWTALAKLRSQ